MNNQGRQDGPIFIKFYLIQSINVCVIVSKKIHCIQRNVFLIGLAALGQVLNAPHLVVFPLMMYENGFDVYKYALLGC